MTEDGLFGVSMCQPKSPPACRVFFNVKFKGWFEGQRRFCGFFWLHVCLIGIATRKVKLGEVQIAAFLAVDII